MQCKEKLQKKEGQRDDKNENADGVPDLMEAPHCVNRWYANAALGQAQASINLRLVWLDFI